VSEASERKLIVDVVALVEGLREDQFLSFIGMLRDKFCLVCGKRYAEDDQRRSCPCESDE
jgi:hypothetical protein